MIFWNLKTFYKKIFLSNIRILAMIAGVWGSFCFEQQGLSENLFMSGEHLVFGNQSVLKMISAKDIRLNGTTVQGDTMAGHDVKGSDCTLQGKVMAGHDVSFNRCKISGNITVGHDLLLEGSTLTSDIKAGSQVSLQDTFLRGNLISSRFPLINRTTITGEIITSIPMSEASASTVHLRDAKIGAVRITRAQQGRSVVNVSGGIVISGSQGRTNVSVSNYGTSNINGYVIKALGSKTLVITPDGSVYENGILISSEPEDNPEGNLRCYQSYQRQFHSAPEVTGPGWLPGRCEAFDSSNRKSKDDDNKPALQIIELSGNTVVQNSIVFESGRGKVILHPGSKVLGKIIGGIVSEE